MMTIDTELKQIVSNYKGGAVEIIEGLDYSQFQTLRKIEFYFNSKYLTGDKDKAGRLKPFYNINKAKLNVAIRATDFDTKDIRIQSDKPHSQIKAMVFRHEIFQWHKDTRFGVTLNKMNETRAKYGGVLVKKVVRDGQVFVEVPEWINLITDQVDVMSGAIIERHFISPVELAKRLPNFNQDISFKDAIQVIKRNNNKRANLTTQDTCVMYEVHGEFPKTYLDEDANEGEYSDQYHVVLGDVDGKTLCLHQEEEKEKPYKYLPWNDVPGRALGVGVIEDGFEAQVWTNDAIMRQGNIMEFASKVLFKSANPAMGGNITAYSESGDVIDTSEGDIALINTTPSSLPVFDNILNQWKSQYEAVASTFSANTGESMPSGTPFRLTMLLNQEANSFFDYRREEMGLFLQEIYEDWLLPHLAKKINKEHILSSEYSPQELKAINKAFATFTANKKYTEKILQGETVTQEDYNAYLENLDANLIVSPFLKVPAGYFTDFKPSISIITTGEQQNKSVQMESIYSIIQLLSANPAMLDDPRLSQLTTRLIEVADIGISAASLMESIQQNQPATAMPEELPQEQEEPVTA